MPSAHAARPLPSRWAIALLGALTAFPSVSVDLYLPSLPTIARTFDRPASEAALTVVVFLLGLALGQLVWGPVSDRYGRRPPLIGGIALYIAASLGCALATSLGALIAFRLVQALGGCAGVVVTRAVVRDRWEGSEVARVLSLLMLVMGAAPLLAPLAGGALLLVAGWRAIFGVLTGFGLLMMVWVLARLPESRSAAVAAQARSESPLVAYAALLRQRTLVGYLVVAAFTQAVLHTYIAVSPDLFITTYHVPAEHYGWIFASNAIGLIGGAQLNHRLLRYRSPDWILRRANAGGLAAGGVLLATALTGFGGLVGILVPLFLAITMIGFTGPNAVACAMAVDPQRSGSAAALIGASQFGAGASCAALAALLHDGSARPMVVVMLGALLLVAGSLRVVIPAAAPFLSARTGRR